MFGRKDKIPKPSDHNQLPAAPNPPAAAKKHENNGETHNHEESQGLQKITNETILQALQEHHAIMDSKLNDLMLKIQIYGLLKQEANNNEMEVKKETLNDENEYKKKK